MFCLYIIDVLGRLNRVIDHEVKPNCISLIDLVY